MDNLLEILIPLIFAAIYFFGNVFSGKDEDESAPTQAPRRRNEDQEADAIERQRRIQEEIRRKIMERRRQAQGGPQQAPQPTEGRVECPSGAPARPEPVVKDNQPASRSSHPSPRAPEPVPQAANPYESQMQARLQQIEATKRQAERLKQQAGMVGTEKVGTAAPSRPQSTRQRSLFRGPVRASLTEPAAARAAFVYAEVLGPPVSQRKSPTVPGLS